MTGLRLLLARLISPADWKVTRLADLNRCDQCGSGEQASFRGVPVCGYCGAFWR